MKKSLILLILPLLFAAGCGNDRSPVDVTEPLSPEEAQVVANCLTVRQAAEDFAAENGRVYPANVTADTSLAGNTLEDLLPGGTALENPFTKIPTEPVNARAAVPGETGYQPTAPGGVFTGYVITGYGADSIIVTLTP